MKKDQIHKRTQELFYILTEMPTRHQLFCPINISRGKKKGLYFFVETIWEASRILLMKTDLLNKN